MGRIQRCCILILPEHKCEIACLIYLLKAIRLFFGVLHLLIESLLDICMMQAVLWYTDTLKVKSTLEEHSALITDVRFSPSMPRLATSSFDKTVRVWDADNVS